MFLKSLWQYLWNGTSADPSRLDMLCIIPCPRIAEVMMAVSQSESGSKSFHIWKALSNIKTHYKLYHPEQAMLCSTNSFKMSLTSNHQLSFWITLLSTLNQWRPLIILLTLAAKLMEQPSTLTTEAEGRAEHQRVSH